MKDIIIMLTIAFIIFYGLNALSDFLDNEYDEQDKQQTTNLNRQ